MSKYNLGIPLLLFFYFVANAQGVYFYNHEIFSRDSTYHAVVSGMNEEGFNGDQKVSLVNVFGDTLWSKIFPENIHFPAVSDSGDLAIPFTSHIEFYNRYGNLKATHKSENHIYSRNFSDAYHVYSSSGERYYYISQYSQDKKKSKKNPSIPYTAPGYLYNCVDSVGAVIWTIKLPYIPQELNAFEDKLILNYERAKCTLFGANGSIIWKYIRKNKGDWAVSVDYNNRIINVKDGNEIIRHDTRNTGTP
jgi:hypothetical protein